jgi:hypothetical protein
MHKNATKCNKTQSKWCINKHGASKIIDMFETYKSPACSELKIEPDHEKKEGMSIFSRMPKITILDQSDVTICCKSADIRGACHVS